MARSGDDVAGSRTVPTNIQEESHLEDEINLIDYFRVLWGRKYFVVLGSVLPALMVGLIIFLLPRNYKMTYIYEFGLDEKGYKTLLDKFYSAENLGKIVAKLRENGLDKYAQKIASAHTDKVLKKLVNFEVSPSYFEVINTSKTTDIDHLRKIQQVSGSLLAMTTVGRSRKDLQKVSFIMRDNFEKVIPLYGVKHDLNSTIANFKTEMANIEENRFSLELELERKKATLAKLKKVEPKGLDKIPGDVVLQFGNVGENSAYLPLAYQIQATESQIIGLEESIRANQEKYNYNKGLLGPIERLFDRVRNGTSSYYTIEEFHSFLTGMISDYQDEELKDYLNAYIKKIENIISTNIPVIEKPMVYCVPKGVAKKSAIVFVISLMVSIFAAFLLAGSKKSQDKAL